MSYGPKGELRGELATSWSLDGDGAWVFKLRPGCVFHNGDPVTAEDVKWSIEQIAGEKSTAYMRSQFQSVERIEIPDPGTIRLITKTPQATLPSWFGNYNTFILSRKSTPTEFIGAGPFRLVGQERGSSVEIAAFDKFYKPGIPKLKGIKFVVYADENLRFAALQSGDVDMIEYVPWQSMAAVEADPRLKLDSQEGPFMDVLFNGTKPPFNDPRVAAPSPMPCGGRTSSRSPSSAAASRSEACRSSKARPWWDKDLSRGWNYDPARAKALLTEAGFGNGFQTTLLATAQFGMHKDTAEIVQQHLAAIGIQCELQLPDWSTRVARGSKGPVRHGDPWRLLGQQRSRRADGRARHDAVASHGRSFRVDARAPSPPSPRAAPSSTRPSASRSTRRCSGPRWRRCRWSASPGSARATAWTRA